MQHSLIKVMIVEDEKVYLDDFLKQVNWETEGFEIVATAQNGRMGLYQYDLFHPQVVITDISMPKLSGLDMIKNILYQDPTVIFVVLSSYDEFSYARQAIKMGVKDYILKIEMTPKYLREKLCKIKKDIEKLHTALLSTYSLNLQKLILEGQQDMARIQELFDPFYNQLSILQGELKKITLQIFQNQYTALNKKNDFKPLEVNSISNLSLFIKNHILLLESLETFTYSQNYSMVVTRAITYMTQNYINPNLRVEDIAYEVGMSPSRLSVLFKKETNKTIIDMLTDIRINNAKNLLKDNQYRVYEVAEMVGYKSTQYFSTIFYKQTKILPTDFRKGYTDD